MYQFLDCTSYDILNETQWILKAILNDQYDAQLVPEPEGVTVTIELVLQTFYDISESSASFTADVLLRQVRILKMYRTLDRFVSIHFSSYSHKIKVLE